MVQQVIHLEEIGKVYRLDSVEVPALVGLNLTICEGEFVTIMGPSGSGKSTLMNILGCLDTPTSGKYFLEGARVDRLSDDQLSRLRNRQFGFVFQSFNLLPRVPAIENVELPAIYAGIPPRLRRSNALDMIERVGLSHRAWHFPHQMSGGEQQRVAIARALINNPRLILADEPTGNLDSKTTEEIFQIFEGLNADGVTIVLVTHEEELAMHSKRIVRLRDGKLVSDAPTRRMIQDKGMGEDGTQHEHS